MSYIDNIFARTNIQQLREFLLHGAECIEISSKDYIQRIEDAQKPILERIKKSFPDQEEHEKITSEVYGYAAVAEDVYMEIGLKCGAILEAQLLLPFTSRYPVPRGSGR